MLSLSLSLCHTQLFHAYLITHDISLCLSDSINAGKGIEFLKDRTVYRDALSSVLGSFSVFILSAHIFVLLTVLLIKV